MKASRSFIVGAFLIGGLVLFGVGLFMIGSENKLFSHTFDTYAYFSNVNGLSSGAKVHVSGLDAGSVSDIKIPSANGSRFRVTLNIDQKGCTIQSTEPVTISDLVKEGRGVLKTLNSTLASAGHVAAHANQALSTFESRGSSGESGPEHLRQTIVDAQRAANNVAEDSEALKHNFFLRGFFKHRGFYSMGQMSAEQYRKSDFVKEKKSKRIWLAADKLFTTARGKEELSEQGRKELDQAMSNFTSYLPNKPLMIEGYSNHGSPADEYRESEERAELVRDYLTNRFQLKPQLTGTMPLGDSPPDKSGQDSWDGVSLVMLT